MTKETYPLAQFINDKCKFVTIYGNSVAQLKRKLSKLPYTIGSADICEKNPEGSMLQYKISYYKPRYHNRKNYWK